MNDTPVSHAPTVAVSATELSAAIAAEVSLSPAAVQAIITLLDDGATVPFIARYRKEATGGADDLSIVKTMERLKSHRELVERKNVILESIHGQGLLTPELLAAIRKLDSRTELEDLYLPFKPKRRTRATMAREKGLEPLADRMWAQADVSGTPESLARPFVDAEKGVATEDEALAGARDIIAERVVETAEMRARIRSLAWKKGLVHAQAARGKAETRSKFTDYYAFSEPVHRVPSHRFLAILRGEAEGFLSVRIHPDPDEAKALLVRAASSGPSIWSGQVRAAVEDGYDRLLSSQIETEIRAELKSRADIAAIEVFARNLRDLLMAPPFGGRPMIAVDPGLRTGCKVVVLGATGDLLDHGVVYPTEPRNDIRGTGAALDRWFEKYPEIAAIGVGNGTGGRETFAVLRDYVKDRGRDVAVVTVNESGASVYSASETARDEFPDQDVTVRGAVSIGRRLQDPLAELVKIDPKSIGVGQYQHDVDQKLLKQKLGDVVTACVNDVGVDLNTASASLLRYVSGLSAKSAAAIILARNASGAFTGRHELLKVPGLGPKTFELAAGFLRVKGSNPLDNSAVHPERYELIEAMAKDLGRHVGELVGDHSAIAAIDVNRYVDDSVGLFTLKDILRELEKPGRDPRRDFEMIEFRDDLHEIGDLRKDMVLDGTVTNVTNFGAFVDVGVHQDGLVHVSQIANRFISNPADVLHVGQKVKVRVMDVDVERKRIGLSIKAV